jgi:predicted transcriptional regulator
VLAFPEIVTSNVPSEEGEGRIVQQPVGQTIDNFCRLLHFTYYLIIRSIMEEMRTTTPLSITLPPEMLKRAKKLASKENRTMSELMREALREYESKRRWDTLNEYGRQKAAELGITSLDELEDYLETRDPDALKQIAESKRDQAAGRMRNAWEVLEELKRERQERTGKKRRARPAKKV